MSASPRITLLERDSASPETQKIYDALLAARGVIPNMFKVLGHRPEIAAGVAGCAARLVPCATPPSAAAKPPPAHNAARRGYGGPKPCWGDG